MKSRVLIIGGGASGLMAAITARRQGASVTILEHTDKIGKKILSTGNGKCNLTNLEQKPEYYRSSQPKFPQAALKAFGVEKTLDFFESIGVYWKSKNGYIYPNSEQAASVLEVLSAEISHLGIPVIYQTEVLSIEKKKNPLTKFNVTTINNRETKSYEADSVILAAGGMAAPITGSDGSGYTLAKSLGHTIVKPVPALVQLRAEGDFFKQLAGVRTEAKVSLFVDRQYIIFDQGELQLTDYGISGIPVFQISRFAARALEEKKKVSVAIDFLPQLNVKETYRFLMNRKKQLFYKNCEAYLIGLFHKKIGQVLLKHSHITPAKKVSQLTEEEVSVLCKKIKEFKINILATNSFANAQVCCGGIATMEIQPDTMESKLIKGLYFSGEIIDVDGICGGYNLQWAWSSGYVAGTHAAGQKRGGK